MKKPCEPASAIIIFLIGVSIVACNKSGTVQTVPSTPGPVIISAALKPVIMDMGTAYWRGLQGGLYPDGLNTRPAAHNNAGLQIASQIKPLDVNGNYDPVNGKIVWLSVGMSNCTQEAQEFILLANAWPNKNAKLILVDGAQGGWDIDLMNDPAAAFWTTINNRLAFQGLSAKQVQAIWFKNADKGPTDTTFTTYCSNFKNKLKSSMNLLQSKFVNSKLCYLSSRIYGGYAASGTLQPEPFAYYTGWAVKQLIEDQINGDTGLTYSGASPKSPWLSWGAYIWAEGATPRADGLKWIFPDDYQTDATHPSIAGRQKVANLLFQFFTTDATTIPWFKQ
ncbi:MAG: hypothetical protein WAU23_00440 [Ferruginibacter sp.]